MQAARMALADGANVRTGLTAPGLGAAALDAPVIPATGKLGDAHRTLIRKRRVCLLVVAMVLMGMTDLLCTLAYMRTSGMVEMNPLARWVATEGGVAGLVSFKLFTLFISGGILLALRTKRVAETCAWVGAACMLALTAHWVHYNAHIPGMTPLMGELAATSPPEWVRLP